MRSGRFKHGDQLSWQGGTRRDLHVAGAVAANGDRSKEGIRFDLSLFLRDFSVVKKIGKNRRSLNPPRNLATAEPLKSKWQLYPDIKRLARDPEWEAIEVRFATHASKCLPPSEE